MCQSKFVSHQILNENLYISAYVCLLIAGHIENDVENFNFKTDSYEFDFAELSIMTECLCLKYENRNNETTFINISIKVHVNCHTYEKKINLVLL